MVAAAGPTVASDVQCSIMIPRHRIWKRISRDAHCVCDYLGFHIDFCDTVKINGASRFIVVGPRRACDVYGSIMHCYHGASLYTANEFRVGLSRPWRPSFDSGRVDPIAREKIKRSANTSLGFT